MPESIPPPEARAELPARGRESQAAGKPRVAGIVGRLTLVNAVVTGLTLLTAPLQARALGPDGRGLLAAIVVTLTYVALIADLGLGAYVTREIARARDLGTVLGTTAVVMLVPATLTLALAPVIAGLVGRSHAVVYDYVLLGMLLTPVTLAGVLLLSANQGLERWRAVYASKLLPSVAGTLALVVLYVTDSLTVASAALVLILSGTLSVLPLAGALRRVQRFRFDRAVAFEAVPFGLKAWVGSLGAITNLRLDQLLMIGLASPRQLGLYAVAASIAGFSSIVTGALTAGLYPRVSAGDREIAVRSLRVTIAGMSVLAAIAAAVLLPLLRVLFGSAFTDAAPMAWILLAADIPLAGVAVLYPALAGVGRPGILARGELLAVVITIPGLLLAIPAFKGVGAAGVSLVAYSANFAYLLRAAMREYGVGLRAFTVPTRADFSAVGAMVRRARKE